MKHVLVLTFDFPPQGGTGAIRVTKFVKYLPQFGWQPVVVCSDAAWNPDESLTRDVPSGAKIYRVGWPRWVCTMRPPLPMPSAMDKTGPTKSPMVSSLKPLIARVAPRLLVPDVNVLWTKGAQRACAAALQEQPCDAMLTTSPPHSVHLVGRWLCARFGLPWVADFRDVWTAENPSLLGLGRLNFMLQRRTERRILEACDRAVMITEPLARCALNVFGEHLADKLLTITNGFDPEDFSTPPPALDKGSFTIDYIGTLLGPQGDNAFPDGLRLALSQDETFRKKVLVRFVGLLDPAYRARLSGLEGNVEIINFVSHATAVNLMRRAHLLLLILPNTSLARTTFTNKFFEYLAARRPILALVPPGPISAIVSEEKIGLVAPPDNALAIAQALLRMFEKVCARPEGHPASDALLNRFDRYALTRKLAAVLDGVTR